MKPPQVEDPNQADAQDPNQVDGASTGTLNWGGLQNRDTANLGAPLPTETTDPPVLPPSTGGSELAPPSPEPPVWEGAPTPPVDTNWDTGHPAAPADPTPSPAATPDPNADLGAPIAARLRELFSQDLTPNLNDPQLAAERLQSQRNFENQRALLAERSGVEGWNNSGGFDTNLFGLGQDRGQADLNAVAGLGKDRVSQIMQALQVASANQQGNNQLGLSYAQLQALLNSQALQSLLAGTGA